MVTEGMLTVNKDTLMVLDEAMVVTEGTRSGGDDH